MIYAAYLHTGKQFKIYLADSMSGLADMPREATVVKSPQHLENAIRKALGEGVTVPDKQDATKVLVYVHSESPLVSTLIPVIAAFAFGVDPTVITSVVK